VQKKKYEFEPNTHYRKRRNFGGFGGFTKNPPKSAKMFSH